MRIKSQTTSVSFAMFLLGMVIIAMPAGMVYAFSADGPVPRGLWVFAALFLIPGGLLAFFSAKRLVQRARLSPWQLECPDAGGVLGQSLAVTLLPPQVINPIGEVQCQLVCLHSIAKSTGTTGRAFETSWTLQPTPISPQAGLPIVLSFPEFGFPSNPKPRRETSWKLAVTMAAEGSTHEMEFEIPVGVGVRAP